ncbi:hypothetical protein DXG03_003776, partial [Asterophora parasitica]
LTPVNQAAITVKVIKGKENPFGNPFGNAHGKYLVWLCEFKRQHIGTKDIGGQTHVKPMIAIRGCGVTKEKTVLVAWMVWVSASNPFHGQNICRKEFLRYSEDFERHKSGLNSRVAIGF